MNWCILSVFFARAGGPGQRVLSTTTHAMLLCHAHMLQGVFGEGLQDQGLPDFPAPSRQCRGSAKARSVRGEAWRPVHGPEHVGDRDAVTRLRSAHLRRKCLYSEYSVHLAPQSKLQPALCKPGRQYHRGCTSILHASSAAQRLEGAVQDQVVRTAQVLGCGTHAGSLQQLAPLCCVAVRTCVCLDAVDERGCHHSLQRVTASCLEGASTGVACKKEKQRDGQRPPHFANHWLRDVSAEQLHSNITNRV